jgi:hypothetical protein
MSNRLAVDECSLSHGDNQNANKRRSPVTVLPDRHVSGGLVYDRPGIDARGSLSRSAFCSNEMDENELQPKTVTNTELEHLS